MNKLIFALILGVTGNMAWASGDQDKDITKFCYHEGKQYSKGITITVGKVKYVCITDPESPVTLAPHDRRLRWASKDSIFITE